MDGSGTMSLEATSSAIGMQGQLDLPACSMEVGNQGPQRHTQSRGSAGVGERLTERHNNGRPTRSRNIINICSGPVALRPSIL